MSERFCKKFRIKKTEDFRVIFKTGVYKRNFEYYDFVFKKNDLSFPRLGIVVKKKNRNAIIRNYEKRIVREIFRRNINCLNLSSDIIIILKKNGEFGPKEKDILNILKFIHEKENIK